MLGIDYAERTINIHNHIIILVPPINSLCFGPLSTSLWIITPALKILLFPMVTSCKDVILTPMNTLLQINIGLQRQSPANLLLESNEL